MQRSFGAFALATLLPVLLLTLSVQLGGLWPMVSFFYITIVVAGLDRFIPAPFLGPAFSARGAAVLSLLLAAAHFWVLGILIASVSGFAGLDTWSRVYLFVAGGLFLGQVSNSNAHELIHRPQKFMQSAGTAIYVSLLFGHHATAHRAVHHRFVGTPHDPNSARAGEGIYRFLIRAWTGSFGKGWDVEADRLERRGLSRWSASNPYWLYVLGMFWMIGAVWLFFGGAGVLALLALAVHAQCQLLVSDYIQHYGLRRRRLSDGSYEPVDNRHSWNAPHWYSSLLMLNAPRHSDHHNHPSREFPRLEMPPAGQAPELPQSLPVMAVLALFPPVWRAVMDPILADWEDVDRRAADLDRREFT